MTSVSGKAYEDLVAEILALFEPTAVVKSKTFVTGPDGSRDIDVSIRGSVNGKNVLVIVECKDYDGAKTGPVGIGIVDAFESKRRDLGADFAIICSNSGFTKPALAKAARVSIGAISILAKHDSRVKVEVQQMVYFRRIVLGDVRITFFGRDGKALELIASEEIYYEQLPVRTWALNRAAILATLNKVSSGGGSKRYRFLDTNQFSIAGRPLMLSALEIVYAYTARWQQVLIRVDSPSGLFDYIRGRISAPVGVQMSFSIDPELFKNGEDLSDPTSDIDVQNFAGEGMFQAAFVVGNVLNGEKIADMDKVIVPSDL